MELISGGEGEPCLPVGSGWVFSFLLLSPIRCWVLCTSVFHLPPRPFTCLRLCNLWVAQRGEGGSGPNLCGSFTCEMSRSLQQSCQQPPGPAALIQHGSDSSKAVARWAVAGLAHKLEVSLCFCRARPENGVFQQLIKEVSAWDLVCGKRTCFCRLQSAQALSSGSRAIPAGWDCCWGKLFSSWFHC